MKNEQQAKDEFYNLINDDPNFKAQWNYDAFYEWCGNYDDLKHITKTKELKKWLFAECMKIQNVIILLV